MSLDKIEAVLLPIFQKLYNKDKENIPRSLTKAIEILSEYKNKETKFWTKLKKRWIVGRNTRGSPHFFISTFNSFPISLVRLGMSFSRKLSTYACSIIYFLTITIIKSK